MKWSLERKLITGSIILSLAVMGGFRLISWRNAQDLIAINQQIQQSEFVTDKVVAINSTITDAEAGRLTYILLNDQQALKRHQAALQRLEDHIQQLNQRLASHPDLEPDFAVLQTLMAQRKVLAQQSITLYQSEPIMTTQQSQLIDQLDQNRLAMTIALAQIQAKEEAQLNRQSHQAADTAYYHIVLELFGTVLIFATLFAIYQVLYRQIAKRNNAELVQQKLAQENAMNELKLNLFSLLSHEFRTPLSIILGSAQLLADHQRQYSDETRLKNLHRIQSSARAMNQLLSDILTLARAEMGKLECHLKVLDLESFCLNLVEDIQLTTAQGRIEFISQSQFAYALLDEALLYHIISNLLSNALKYSPSDSRVYLILKTEEDRVIFQVTDQGIGIEPADQIHLYEPFHRGHNSSGKLPGAGLGLAVVKKCVDLLKGNISVTSQIGVGTTFTLCFQRGDVPPVALQSHWSGHSSD